MMAENSDEAEREYSEKAKPVEATRRAEIERVEQEKRAGEEALKQAIARREREAQREREGLETERKIAERKRRELAKKRTGESL
jgi:hypothetical protein